MAQYEEKYAPYDARAPFLYVREAADYLSTDKDAGPLGLTQMLLPDPQALTVLETKTKTVHDLTDPIGDPQWGTLDLSDAGRSFLDGLWPAATMDVLVHFRDHTAEERHRARMAQNEGVDQSQLDVNAILESMQAGFLLGHAAFRLAGVNPPDHQSVVPASVTNMVAPYDQLSRRRYGDTGVVFLGDQTPYGADPHDSRRRQWARALVMSARGCIDRDAQSPHPRLAPGLFDEVCPPAVLHQQLQQLYEVQPA